MKEVGPYMKTKRILSTFLAAVMMITMLAACGAADATKEFFALNDALRDIRSGTFHEEVTITVPKELSNNAILNAIGLPMDNLDKDITIDAELDMSINCKKKEAEISFEGAYNGKKPMKVTTVYLKDETAYVNVVELVDFIQNGLDMGDALGIPSEDWKEQLDAQLEGMDYVLIPIETSTSGATKDMDLWDLIEGEGGSELVSLLNDALKSSSKDNKLVAVTEESDAKYYTLSISNETLAPAAVSTLDYLQEHEDNFFDAINAFMENIGADTIPDGQRPSDDDWDELRESVNDIEVPDFSFSYGLHYDKKDKKYSHILELDIPDTLPIETAGIASDEVKGFKIPAAYDFSNQLELPTVMPDFNNEPVMPENTDSPIAPDTNNQPAEPAMFGESISKEDMQQMVDSIRVDINDDRLYKGIPFTATWDNDGAEVLNMTERLFAESFPEFTISSKNVDAEGLSIDAYIGEEFGNNVEVSMDRDGGAAADFNYTNLEVTLQFESLEDAERLLPTFVQTLRQCGYVVSADSILPVINSMCDNAKALVGKDEFGSFIVLSDTQDPIELCAYISSYGVSGYRYLLSVSE